MTLIKNCENEEVESNRAKNLSCRAKDYEKTTSKPKLENQSRQSAGYSIQSHNKYGRF